MHRRRTDPLGRKVALQIGAGRVALGLATLFLTEPALKGLGFSEPEATGRALAKLAGGRDIALGAATLAARDDRERLRALMLVSAACDLADAITLGAAAGQPETRRAGVNGGASGAGAAIACLWAARRLSY